MNISGSPLYESTRTKHYCDPVIRIMNYLPESAQCFGLLTNDGTSLTLKSTQDEIKEMKNDAHQKKTDYELAKQRVAKHRSVAQNLENQKKLVDFGATTKKPRGHQRYYS